VGPGSRIHSCRKLHRYPVPAHDLPQPFGVGWRGSACTVACDRYANLLEELLGHPGGGDDKENPPRFGPLVPVPMENPGGNMHDRTACEADRTGWAIGGPLAGEREVTSQDIERFLARLAVERDAPSRGDLVLGEKLGPFRLLGAQLDGHTISEDLQDFAFCGSNVSNARLCHRRLSFTVPYKGVLPPSPRARHGCARVAAGSDRLNEILLTRSSPSIYYTIMQSSRSGGPLR
jgi:hypothetical protein